MKKKVTVLFIVGLCLLGVGIGLFICNPFILKAMDKGFYTVDDIFINFMPTLKLMFGSTIPLATWIAIGVGGLFVVLWIIHLIILIVKKAPGSIWRSVFWLLAGAVMFFGTYILLFNFGEKGEGLIEAVAKLDAVDAARLIAYQGGYFAPVMSGTALCVDNKAGGYFSWIIDIFKGEGINVGILILLLAPFVLILAGFIILLIGFISDMVYMCENAQRRSVSHEDYGTANAAAPVVIIHDDETNDTPNGDEIRAIMHDELENTENGKVGAPAPAAAPVQGSVSTTGFSGPFLIQYINTYNPSDNKSVPMGKEVCAKEVDENINGEKNLSADDIRRIIKEELDAKNEPAQPVIVTVPSQAEPKAEKALTADEIRNIIKDELSVKEDDVIVEEMEAEPEPLTADAIRAIIKEELASKEADEEEDVEDEEEIELIDEKDIRDIIREELMAFHADKEEAENAAKEEEAKRLAEEEARRAEIEAAKALAMEEARREAEEKAKALEEERKAEEARLAAEEEARKAEEAKKAEEEARKAEEEAERARREEEAKANMLSADDIRQIIAEELAKNAPKEEKEDLAITAEAIREIIRSELKAAEPVKEEPKVEEVAPVVVEEPKVEEPVPAPAPQITVVVNNPEPAPAPAPAPSAEEEAKKIERIPFPTRMLTADKDLQANYNQLKSEILSYGVKSRVSNSGDTFRLHKVTYVKITIAGKSLKLYFALDPKDYENSPIPVQDAGHKDIYKEIPCVFKVKSELSVRRASQLIADCMEKAGLEQGKLEPINWVKELVDYKPTGSKD